MASNAAADSGASFCVAASTSDQRVCGKIRGASLDEVRLLIGKEYPDELPETRCLLQTLCIKSHVDSVIQCRCLSHENYSCSYGCFGTSERNYIFPSACDIRVAHDAPAASATRADGQRFRNSRRKRNAGGRSIPTGLSMEMFIGFSIYSSEA